MRPPIPRPQSSHPTRTSSVSPSTHPPTNHRVVSTLNLSGPPRLASCRHDSPHLCRSARLAGHHRCRVLATVARPHHTTGWSGLQQRRRGSTVRILVSLHLAAGTLQTLHHNSLPIHSRHPRSYPDSGRDSAAHMYSMFGNSRPTRAWFLASSWTHHSHLASSPPSLPPVHRFPDPIRSLFAAMPQRATAAAPSTTTATARASRAGTRPGSRKAGVTAAPPVSPRSLATAPTQAGTA